MTSFVVARSYWFHDLPSSEHLVETITARLHSVNVFDLNIEEKSNKIVFTFNVPDMPVPVKGFVTVEILYGKLIVIAQITANDQWARVGYAELGATMEELEVIRKRGEEIAYPIFQWFEMLTADEWENCSAPDCGCPERRLCPAKNGPNSVASLFPTMPLVK